MFRFTLQPVLEQRRAREDACQREYAQVSAGLEEARLRRREIDADLNRRREQIRASQLANEPFALREIVERYIDGQAAAALELDGAIRKLASEAEAARLRLVEAMKAKLVIEKLRDRERDDWRSAESRAELKNFDEIAVRDWAGQRRREKDSPSPERIAS